MDDAEKRRRLRAHYAECDRIQAERERLEAEFHRRVMRNWLPWLGPHPHLELPDYPVFPDDLRGMALDMHAVGGSVARGFLVATVSGGFH